MFTKNELLSIKITLQIQFLSIYEGRETNKLNLYAVMIHIERYEV